MQYRLLAKPPSVVAKHFWRKRDTRGKLSKGGNETHCFSTWLLQALQEAVCFQAECICIKAIKEPALRFLGECCLCMPFVTGFSNCEEKYLLPCAQTVLWHSLVQCKEQKHLCVRATQSALSVSAFLKLPFWNTRILPPKSIEVVIQGKEKS